MLAEEMVYDLLSTRKMRKFTVVSLQNMKDHDEILLRMQVCGVQIDLVTEILESKNGGRVTVEHLLSFARKLSKKLGIRLDRLANRNRNALLCWYCENWSVVFPHLDDFNSKTGSKTMRRLPQIPKLPRITNYIDPSDIHQLLNHHN